MTAPTLTEFILARIAEDEDDASEATTRADAHWENESRLGQIWTVANDEGHLIHMPALRSPLGAHIARHDPARVLAECEVKRAELEELERMLLNGSEDERTSAVYLLGVKASVHSAHPDYRAEWKP